MRFHFPSFLLGFGAGGVSVLLARRIRPVMLEIATTAYRMIDSVGARVAMVREDFQDVLAEARARARGLTARPDMRASA